MYVNICLANEVRDICVYGEIKGNQDNSEIDILDDINSFTNKNVSVGV